MNRDQSRNEERGTRNRADRLRAINAPHRVEVVLDANGYVAAILDAEHGMRTVENIGEVWRIDDEWWRQPIMRQYVEAVLEGGGRVVLFEDQTNGEWWMQKPT